MKKVKEKSSRRINLKEIIGLVLALLYTQSVLTVAHHAAFRPHNGTPYIVEAPAVPLLVIGLALIGYAWMKKKGAPSMIIVISLTIFATASLFWLSGLRANFFN